MREFADIEKWQPLFYLARYRTYKQTELSIVIQRVAVKPIELLYYNSSSSIMDTLTYPLICFSYNWISNQIPNSMFDAESFTCTSSPLRWFEWVGVIKQLHYYRHTTLRYKCTSVCICCQYNIVKNFIQVRITHCMSIIHPTWCEINLLRHALLCFVMLY